MPPDYKPSWEQEIGTDSWVESGGPTGDVTEEQVREWLRGRGFAEEEISEFLTKGSGAGEKPPESGPTPLFPGDRAGK